MSLGSLTSPRGRRNSGVPNGGGPAPQESPAKAGPRVSLVGLCFQISKPASSGKGCKLDGMRVQLRPAGRPRVALPQRRRSTRRHSNHWDGIGRKDRGESRPRTRQQLERPNCLEFECSQMASLEQLLLESNQ